MLGFISPCVLPLIPGYLAFISGVSLEETRGVPNTSVEDTAAKRQVIIASLFFVLGFSLIFVGLGATATALGQFMTERVTMFAKIAGVLLIIFGLHAMRVVKTNIRPARMTAALIVGISFAFGWSPYFGPTLAAILAVASQRDSVNHGIALLSIYSLGLAIPFLLTALAINQLLAASTKARRHHHAIEIVSGLMMIVIGVLILTNRFTIVAQWLSPYLPAF